MQIKIRRYIDWKSSCSVLQDVVTSSELLVTLPSRAAKVYARNGDVNIFELPFSVKPFNVSVNWYNHRDDLDA